MSGIGVILALVLAQGQTAPITIGQGHAFQVSIADEPGLQSAELQWLTSKVPFARQAGRWITVAASDLDTKAGRYVAKAFLTFAGRAPQTREIPVVVTLTKYPRTALQVDNQFVELSPENEKRAAAEQAEMNAIFKKIAPEAMWTNAFALPIPGATGRNFGHRRVFNGKPRNPHTGADLRAATGTPIRATNRGRVVLAKDLFFSGNCVILDHGLGVFSLYAHLSEIQTRVGDIVDVGHVVGLAGATGRVTGPHLHWGVRIRDARVDPFTLLTLK